MARMQEIATMLLLNSNILQQNDQGAQKLINRALDVAERFEKLANERDKKRRKAEHEAERALRKAGHVCDMRCDEGEHHDGSPVPRGPDVELVVPDEQLVK